MPGRSLDGLDLRPWSGDDLDGALELLLATRDEDTSLLDTAFLRWKHFENPFGASPGWVACEPGGRIVGLRVFLRWELADGDRIVPAARAVDTAVHPDWQRRGLFSELTRRSLDTLRATGVELIFNPPNDRSRPGYLKLGWTAVGRLPASISPTRLGSLGPILGARTPAERSSVATGAGTPAAALGDARLRQLADAGRARPGLATHRSAAYLAWRYGYAPLGYRVWPAEPDDRPAVVFRLRRRGGAVEAAICDTFPPPGPASGGRAATTSRWRSARAAAADAGADYAMVLERWRPTGLPFLPVPGQGPVLTCRALSPANCAPRRSWTLALGDVELF